MFSTFNELHPNYFRHLLHALGMNIKVDDMKSNTQSTVVPFLPHLAAAFTSVLTVSSALPPRITLHSILCFAGFLQLVFLCSKSIPWQDYKLLYRATWSLGSMEIRGKEGWRVEGGGEGGEGRVNSLSCSRLSASWNCMYRTFKLVRIYTTSSPLLSSAIAKPAKYANAREKRHSRKVTRLLY